MYLFSYALSRNHTLFSWTIVNEYILFLRKSEGIDLKFIVHIKRNDYAMLISVGKKLHLLCKIQWIGKSVW